MANKTIIVDNKEITWSDDYKWAEYDGYYVPTNYDHKYGADDDEGIIYAEMFPRDFFVSMTGSCGYLDGYIYITDLKEEN